MVINTALETFDDNSERIVWLPSITLGYTYTLSGDDVQFWLAVGAIGGAVLFKSLLESEYVSQNEGVNSLDKGLTYWFKKNFHGWKLWWISPFIIIYLISILYAPYQLYHHFSHQNILVVGLSGFWLSILVTILVKV
jgi:hypothetical protein